MTIEQSDLEQISAALAPAIGQLLTQTASTLKDEFTGLIAQQQDQLDSLANAIVMLQADGMDAGAMEEAYRRFVVGEARKLLVKPSELKAERASGS